MQITPDLSAIGQEHMLSCFIFVLDMISTCNLTAYSKFREMEAGFAPLQMLHENSRFCRIFIGVKFHSNTSPRYTTTLSFNL